MALNAREQLANIPVIANETTRMAQAFRSWPESYWSRRPIVQAGQPLMRWPIWRRGATFMRR